MKRPRQPTSWPLDAEPTRPISGSGYPWRMTINVIGCCASCIGRARASQRDDEGICHEANFTECSCRRAPYTPCRVWRGPKGQAGRSGSRRTARCCRPSRAGRPAWPRWAAGSSRASWSGRSAWPSRASRPPWSPRASRSKWPSSSTDGRGSGLPSHYGHRHADLQQRRGSCFAGLRKWPQ
jgi:hypothetical protein